MNIAISSENTGKVTEDAIFSCAVCIKKVRNNSILWYTRVAIESNRN